MSLFDFIYIVCGVPWLFLMITTSGAYTTQKMVLVFALCITSILEIFIKRQLLQLFAFQFIVSLVYYWESQRDTNLNLKKTIH